MKPGLYKVHFQTPLGVGAGVVYTDGVKLWGGDYAIYYLGEFTQNGERLQATVQTNRHSPSPAGMTTVFGRDRVTINLDGVVSGETVNCKGTSPEAPGVSFSCTLSRISD